MFISDSVRKSCVSSFESSVVWWRGRGRVLGRQEDDSLIQQLVLPGGAFQASPSLEFRPSPALPLEALILVTQRTGALIPCRTWGSASGCDLLEGGGLGPDKLCV